MHRLPQCELPFKQFLNWTGKGVQITVVGKPIPTVLIYTPGKILDNACICRFLRNWKKYLLKVLKRNIIACLNFRFAGLYDFFEVLCRDRLHKRSELIRKK